VQKLRVRDQAAFTEVQQHILSHYAGVNVTHSFVDIQHFDCVTIESQPSLPKGGRLATPPPILMPSKTARGANKATSRLEQGHVDAEGSAIRCEAGTIPMLRITFDRMLMYETLQHFLHKYPTQNMSAHRVTHNPHKHSHASQRVSNWGGGSDINIWDPSGDFTLSQIWIYSYGASGLQTAECGNLHYPPFGSTASLFIFFTADGYDKTGCYNLDCKAFVQTDSKVALGGRWDIYSTLGGDQREASFAYQFYEGNWWFQLNGVNVGYYPGSLYDNGPMALGSASTVDFGGETFNLDLDNWPEMGSGDFAGDGWREAAYQKHIYYILPGGNTAYYASLTPYANYPSCYTIDYHSDDYWGTYFFFGGPGGPAGGCNSVKSKSILV